MKPEFQEIFGNHITFQGNKIFIGVSLDSYVDSLGHNYDVINVSCNCYMIAVQLLLSSQTVIINAADNRGSSSITNN